MFVQLCLFRSFKVTRVLRSALLGSNRAQGNPLGNFCPFLPTLPVNYLGKVEQRALRAAPGRLHGRALQQP